MLVLLMHPFLLPFSSLADAFLDFPVPLKVLPFPTFMLVTCWLNAFVVHQIAWKEVDSAGKEEDQQRYHDLYPAVVDPPHEENVEPHHQNGPDATGN